MKRLYSIFVFLLIAVCINAQTQQGLVKTIGRPNKPGVLLGGVSVRIRGNVNTILSTPQGTFSFPLKERRFKFSRISKKGYEIADRDFLHYDFGYSPNAPITIAMVSTEELQRERDAIFEQARLKLDLRYQEQNAKLEKKFERNLLSEEEYKKQLLALHEKHDDTDTLVSVLSDLYARTDYDNIDSFRLVINRHIENGELERAQQLIMSKGNLDERARELEETRKQRLQTQMREERLQKDLASDLFQLYKIAHLEQKYDSAYIYLEKRYLTDTIQINYLSNLISYIYPRWRFSKNELQERDQRHLSYLFKLYNYYQNHSDETDQHMKIIQIQQKIGTFYHSMHDDDNAMKFYEEALNKNRINKTGLEYILLQGLGNVYLSSQKYQLALSTYQKAYRLAPKASRNRARIQEEVANIYYLMGEKDNALNEYIMLERLYATPKDSDTWEIEQLYILQGFIASTYINAGKYKEAEKYYTKAKKNAERYYQLTNKIKAIEPIFIFLQELQKIYATQRNYKKVYTCAEEAMYYADLYMKRMPSAYSRLLYAEVLCQKADAHANMGKTDNVERELVECLKKGEFASNVFRTRYRKLTYRVYNAFAVNYAKQKLLSQALNAVNKAITINPNEKMAYQRKIGILSSMGNNEEVQKTIEELQSRDIVESNNDSDMKIYDTSDPLLEYEFNVLRIF